jgi:hypothetical protein
MAKRKIKHEPTDYHTAMNLHYNGVAGEYITMIPARNLTPLDVVTTAARLDMSVGGFVDMVTVQAKNKNGAALYIIPIEDKPKKIKTGDDEPKPEIEEQSHG